MFKKEMFPRVKQKPAISEDYFSLSTDSYQHSCLYILHFIQVNTTTEHNKSLLLPRQKSRREMRICEMKETVTVSRWGIVCAIYPYSPLFYCEFKRRKCEHKVHKDKVFSANSLLNMRTTDGVKEKVAVSSVTFSFDLSLIMAGTSRQS